MSEADRTANIVFQTLQEMPEGECIRARDGTVWQKESHDNSGIAYFTRPSDEQKLQLDAGFLMWEIEVIVGGYSLPDRDRTQAYSHYLGVLGG